MEKVLKFLSGKKSTIASLIALVVTYMVIKNVIDIDTAALINGISVLLFGATSIATKSIYNK